MVDFKDYDPGIGEIGFGMPGAAEGIEQLIQTHRDAYGKPEYQNFENLYGVYPAVEDYAKMIGNAGISFADFLGDSAQAGFHLLKGGNVLANSTKTTIDAGLENKGIYNMLGFEPMKDNVLLDGQVMKGLTSKVTAEGRDYLDGLMTQEVIEDFRGNTLKDIPWEQWRDAHPGQPYEDYTNAQNKNFDQQVDEKYSGPVKTFVDERYQEYFDGLPGMENNGIGQFYENPEFRFKYSGPESNELMEFLEMPVELGLDIATGKGAYSAYKGIRTLLGK